MTTRSIKAAATAVVAFAALTATSYGYLGSTGSGSGAGSAAVDRELVISGGADAGNTLLPTGETNGRLTVSLHNPTGTTLRAGSLALDTQRGTNGYDAEAIRCKVTFPAAHAGPWTVAAGATEPITIESAVRMGTDAPGDCQGGSFKIYLKVAS